MLAHVWGVGRSGTKGGWCGPGVQVSVAPSTVTVTLEAAGGGGQVLAECRVRFLSFLGIGREVT